MPATSIRFRLFLALLLIIGVSGAVGAVSHLRQVGDTSVLKARSANLLELIDLGHELEEAIGVQHSAILSYLLTGEPEKAAAYHAARIDEAKLIGASDAVVVGHVELLAALNDLERASEDWRAKFADPSIGLIQTGQGDAARAPGRIGNGEALYGAVVAADVAFDGRVGALNAANVDEIDRIEQDQFTMFLIGTLGSLLGVIAATWLLRRWVLRPIGALLATAKRAEAGEDVAFATGRGDEIGQLGHALETMHSRLFGQAEEASVVNRFTELTAFVEADGDVARATLDALAEIVSPDDGTIHITDSSRDRALPEGSVGEVTPALISLGQLALCPGVRRSSLYVTSDLGEGLGVRCPVYPAVTGTLACIPLVALGEVVGVVHLHWHAVDALPLDVRRAATRITEHASLSIANRRLMTALQGMANTDGRTGLTNSRAFDDALGARLETLGKGEHLSVLMLDLDHFKDFNDRNGHPAGDAALRVFAGVLQGAVRDGDLAARYGGEEFVVMLPGASTAEAAMVAERIRAQTAETIIDLSPGHRDQITVSVGVAAWPGDATDQAKLLEVADAALYRAKNAGRNQVVVAGEVFRPRLGLPADDAETAPVLGDLAAG
ncbi:MAG TPA: diguanylate cyclase [Candidatus Limnocylindrales bacterium]